MEQGRTPLVKEEHANGVNLRTGWHSDNESLFGPQNKPKLIVIMIFRPFCGVPGSSRTVGCALFNYSGPW